MKNVSYLIKYAAAQIGRPYWCGTFGQIANEWLYHYNKSRLPMYYTANDFTKQFGQKVHDCVGLVKGAMWCNTPDSAPVYVASQDVTVEAMYKSAIDRGVVSNLNGKPCDGALLFNSSFGHVGVYIGNGYVVEAKGHAYGVVKSVYIPSNWAYWCKCVYFDYATEKPVNNEELKPNDRFTLSKDATIYGTSKKFASFVYDVPLYVIEINKNRVVFSIAKGGAVTGATNKKYCTKF